MFGEQTFAQLRTGFRQRSSPPWHVEDPVPRQTPQVGPPGVEADRWAHQAAESEKCSVSLSMHSFTSPSRWSACLTHHFTSTAIYSPHSRQSASPCTHLLLCLAGQPVSHLTSLYFKSTVRYSHHSRQFHPSFNYRENGNILHEHHFLQTWKKIAPQKTACVAQIHTGIKQNLLLRGALFNFFRANSKTL